MRTLEEIKQEWQKMWDEYDRLDIIYKRKTREYEDFKWEHYVNTSNLKSKIHVLEEEFKEYSRGLNKPPNINDGYQEYLENRKRNLGW